MKKTVQYFSEAYLKKCESFTSEEIIDFLESFRQLQAEIETSKRNKTKLISLKISENLLSSFRALAKAHGIPYQTQIKNLMTQWVRG
jgi:predicted DNA binding CopG/RHH family protein